MVIINRQLNTLDHGSLSLCTDLLSALESDERVLEIMRRLLERSFLMGLFVDDGLTLTPSPLHSIAHQSSLQH